MRIYLSEKQSSFVAIVTATLFIGSGWYALETQHWWALVLPFLLPLGWIFFQDVRFLWYAGIFSMPLSILIQKVIGNAALSIPTDFISLLILSIFLLKHQTYFPKIFRYKHHLILRLLIAWIAWMAFCCFTSELPLVSVKYWLSTLWFCTSFYFFSLIILETPQELTRWYKLAAIALIPVLIYTITNHAMERFTHQASYTIMRPFYPEHTVYAASIAIFLPGSLLSLWLLPQVPFWKRLSFLGLLAFAILTSYTRGAWLGCLAGCGLVLFLLLRQYWKLFLQIGLIVLSLLGIFIFSKWENLQESGEDMKRPIFSSNFSHHLTSITNTSTNVSNRERINRWVAALNMIQEKPLTGFGPGTYAMTYAPYQRSRYKTYISSNQGNAGTAHNEYLLAASEMGIIGVCLIVVLFLSTIFYGIRGFIRQADPKIRWVYGTTTGGLITFYVHGLVNNFLDQDKVAIPVFLCMALITSLDCYHTSNSYANEAA
ncbi:MAG: O-antigen ligase family protein [Bacteroidia bacterium]|nr:O-antigen ligase family protein [Bacteroidia bacterium]